jgi:hypothetical protein
MIFVVDVEENRYIFLRVQAISKKFSQQYSAIMALNFAARSLLNSKIYSRLLTFEFGLSRNNADFEVYVDQ